jgi:hypothetical protein
VFSNSNVRKLLESLKNNEKLIITMTYSVGTVDNKLTKGDIRGKALKQLEL